MRICVFYHTKDTNSCKRNCHHTFSCVRIRVFYHTKDTNSYKQNCNLSKVNIFVRANSYFYSTNCTNTCIRNRQDKLLSKKLYLKKLTR